MNHFIRNIRPRTQRCPPVSRTPRDTCSTCCIQHCLYLVFIFYCCSSSWVFIMSHCSEISNVPQRYSSCYLPVISLFLFFLLVCFLMINLRVTQRNSMMQALSLCLPILSLATKGLTISTHRHAHTHRHTRAAVEELQYSFSLQTSLCLSCVVLVFFLQPLLWHTVD